MTTTRTGPTRAERFESVVLVLILLAVAGFAGAASFTHVKDWTLTNSPPGTGAWFGWANAVISELVPIAALLTIRRRRRTHAPIGYPMTLLVLSAGLSLAAQLAVAKPGLSGWLLSAVPALAFMALAKLVLTPIPTQPTTDETVTTHVSSQSLTSPVDQPTTPDTATNPTAGADLEPVGTEVISRLEALLPTARFAVVNHEQTTGRRITTDELAVRMSVPSNVAGRLLAVLNPPATITTPQRVNGAPVLGGDAR